MKKCPLCNGDIVLSAYAIIKGEYTLTVPAFYCAKCGEMWDKDPVIGEYFEQLMGLVKEEYPPENAV